MPWFCSSRDLCPDDGKPHIVELSRRGNSYTIEPFSPPACPPPSLMDRVRLMRGRLAFIAGLSTGFVLQLITVMR